MQGDANEIAIRCLKHCSVPAKILNVTGPETVSLRWLAEQFGKMLGVTPKFINEATTRLHFCLMPPRSFRLFGYPKVTLKQMMEVILEMVKRRRQNDKQPTHFSERKGKY
jgi:hypothetical protein